jgi:hypothetical protein
VKLWRIGDSGKPERRPTVTLRDRITAGLELRARAAAYAPDLTERGVRSSVVHAAQTAWAAGQHPLEAARAEAETFPLQADRDLAHREADALDRMMTQLSAHEATRRNR